MKHIKLFLKIGDFKMPTGVYIRTENYRKKMALVMKPIMKKRWQNFPEKIKQKILQKLHKFQKGNVPYNKGIKKWTTKSEKIKKEQLERLKLGRGFHKNCFFKKGHPNYLLNHSQETKEKIRKAFTGSNNHQWKGGITPLVRLERNSQKYKDWQQAVFKRDNFKCWICGHQSTKLHAHHKRFFADNPDLRFDINNGITLCDECHRLVHYNNRLAIKIYKERQVG